MSATPSFPALRIGVIGTGARIRTVIEHLQTHAPEVRVTAVFDPDPQSISAFLCALDAKAVVCASEHELCARPDVDWVFIGSWNSQHAHQAVAAFRAGKHVFCEKPLALSLMEAAHMHAAWKISGRTFAFGLVLRYSPLYRKARSLLDEGHIGSLLSFEFNETLPFNHGGYIHGNWRRHREHAGTHLLEKCCHDIDLALWLTGDLPIRVASFGGLSFFLPENAHHAARVGPSPEGRPAYRAWPDPHGVDPFTADKSIVDHQVAILEFSRGVRATFHTSCHAAIPERRFYLLGTEGSLRLDACTGTIEVRRIGWDEPLVIHEPTKGDPHAGGDERMGLELADIMLGRRTPSAGFPEGLHSLTTALAIDAALDTGSVIDLRPRWQELAATFTDTIAASATV